MLLDDGAFAVKGKGGPDSLLEVDAYDPVARVAFLVLIDGMLVASHLIAPLGSCLHEEVLVVVLLVRFDEMSCP